VRGTGWLTRRRLAATALAGAALVAGSAMFVATSAASTPGRPDHIFVIMMENHGYDEVICADPKAASCATPKITNLARTYGLATNYYGVTHDSRPNRNRGSPAV
jgi:hypothetical protein